MRRTSFGGYLFKYCSVKYQSFQEVSERTSQQTYSHIKNHVESFPAACEHALSSCQSSFSFILISLLYSFPITFRPGPVHRLAFQMPPRAIKHQLTCPIELTSGSFLIGRRGILAIPRNRQESLGSAKTVEYHLCSSGAIVCQYVKPEVSYIRSVCIIPGITTGDSFLSSLPFE